MTTGRSTARAKGAPTPKVSKAPTISTQPIPSSTRKTAEMSSAPRTIPKSRSSHHPAPRLNPKSEKDRLSRKRPASHTVRTAPTSPATLLASGIAGESGTTNAPDPPPETARTHPTKSALKTSGTTTRKAPYWIANRQSALGLARLPWSLISTLRLRLRLSARRFAPCQHAQASAFACQQRIGLAGLAFSFLPFRPRPAAHEEPLPKAVGFYACGGASRGLTDKPPTAGRWRADKRGPKARSVLTSRSRRLERADKRKPKAEACFQAPWCLSSIVSLRAWM